MYLEEVVIEGFKSFSEPTEMGFQPGIGVIMGNNGVGKSNILDAIVWALGENDLCRIRCYDPEEMFFAGSSRYSPARKIRVTLVFSHGGDKSAPSMTVQRELDRNGSERYMIGETEYGRQDYLEKLELHRLRHALKTIIRQEEINDLIRLGPEQRLASLKEFLEAESEKELVRRLSLEAAPLFYRYMACLIPGGETRLLVDENRLDITVSLPGNRKRRAHQLSGGEKAITSLALRLAVFGLLDSPFYMLDEVEPALDYTNHKAMQAFLKDVAKNRQLS